MQETNSKNNRLPIKKYIIKKCYIQEDESGIKHDINKPETLSLWIIHVKITMIYNLWRFSNEI